MSSSAQTIRLTDIDQLSRLFGDWQGWFDQISSGRFEASLQLVRGEAVRAIGIQANQRVRIRGADAAGLVTISPVTLGSVASLWQGRSLPVGQVVLTGAETELDYTSPRVTTHHMVSLPPDQLDEAVRALLNTDVPELPRGWTAVAAPPAVFARLEQLLSRFVQACTTGGGPLRTPEGRMLEQELVRAVVAVITAKAATRTALSLPARHRLVLGAEELMRSRLADPIGAVDLCRRLRVSDRTLRLAFRERYGMGPMGYLKCLRLNAVRTALKADRHLTVAAAATAFGFHHLGNFAADYRRLFGEKPSDTVRSPRPA
jgi:AraC family ethanolamine operon transcriptional activator